MSRESSGGESSQPQELVHQGADNPVASTSTQETPESTDNSIEESIQVCGNELERDWSDQLWKRCENKEIHKNYISAEDFRRNGKDRLPARYQTDDWFNLVIAFMNLTLRIVVYRHSRDRPNPIIGDEPSFGSGFITRYNFDRDANGNRVWKFRVNTAKHVIFDESELKTARFDLFYESEDSNVESLVGSKFIGFREDHDNIWFDVLTKDKVLAKKIIDTFEKLMDLKRKVFSNHYPEALGPRERSDFSKTPKDIVIISHPHGKPKKISMGEVLKRDVVESWYRRDKRYLMEWLECFHNAPTCKGSSGAEILFLGDEGERGRYGWTIGAHRCKKDGNGFGSGILFTYDSGWNKIFFW